MNIEDIKIKLEELEVPSDKIDEFVAMVESDQIKANNNQAVANEKAINDKILELQNKLNNETDWRKKASLSARILSLKL